ncbi:hypothetical protein [Angelakisella massiliensis]|uniref:hypothetical protein n=1 Tax=Angelakisella massiliensis TaxID=1871018 RepID=UPI0024B0DD16|nr:hypothetical protein [Angelakisella massiliensis]
MIDSFLAGQTGFCLSYYIQSCMGRQGGKASGMENKHKSADDRKILLSDGLASFFQGHTFHGKK